MLFDFQAVDQEGSTLEGDVNAPSEEQARWLLRKEFPNLRRIVWIRPQLVGKPTILRVPYSEVVIFYRRLAVMLEAGVSIDRALMFSQNRARVPWPNFSSVFTRTCPKGTISWWP